MPEYVIKAHSSKWLVRGAGLLGCRQPQQADADANRGIIGARQKTHDREVAKRTPVQGSIPKLSLNFSSKKTKGISTMNPVTQEPRGLTAERAAEILDLNVDTVRRYLAAGRIPGTKFGKTWRIADSTVRALLEGQLQILRAAK